MAVTIVLGIGQGNFEQDGFPVSLQIRDRGIVIKQENNCAWIPPAPKIPKLYSDLHERYNKLGQTRRLEPVQGQTTHVSSDEVLEACKDAAEKLKKGLESWFENPKFQSLRDRILRAETKAVGKTSEVENTSVPIIIDVYTGNDDQDTLLRKLPWNLWDLFKELKNAEPVLSAKINRPSSLLTRPVRILAIFGSSESEGQQGRLKLEADLDALKQLEQFGAKIHPVIEPSRSEIHYLLWEQSWDILFFAGHSSSEEGHQNGYLQIGSRRIAVANLAADLEQTVKQGLKLAIFNSCDGLGIANYLAYLDVPSMIVMREPVPDLVARKFLRFFLKAFSTGKPMYLAVQEARKRLESQEEDDKYPCPAASWLPIICQNPSQPELIWPTTDIPNPENKPSTWKRFAAVGIVGLLLLATGKIVVDEMQRPASQITQPFAKTESYLISLGETILIKTDGAEKQKGSDAFAKGNYSEARDDFKASLEKKPNDPEALIYLNNAIVNLNPNRPPRRIAVSVPIGSNVNVASEMLRGIAQAQNEINNKDGAKLEIKIANDSNNEQIARSIAAEFVNDDKILAVVGHNASNVSKAAADIYQNRGLVMITPASFADILSGFSPYIFRTVPNPQLMAYRLAKYVINTAKKTNIAVCYDSEATDNNSFKESFVESLKKLGGRDIPVACNLAVPTFNANAVIAEAIQNQADGLMLSPHIDRISKAIELAKANNGKLPLFGSPTLYTYQTLQEGQANVNALVLSCYASKFNKWHYLCF